MSNINIFGKVLGTATQFKKFILNNISEIINRRLFNNLNSVEKDISTIIINNIKEQPEYSSLKSGSLRNQFGIANTSVVDSILLELDDIQVKIIKPIIKGDSIQANLIINMINNNFSEIISSSSAAYISEKGSQIEWLRWLLLEGNNSVIIGYKYKPKTSPNSRTGKGIMIKGEGNIFRVPPEFAGTSDNNWITRGVDASLPEIQSYINRIVKQAL